MNQKDVKHITDDTIAFLEKVGAEKLTEENRFLSYEYKLITIFGNLYIRLDPPKKGDRNGVYWIFQRFDKEATERAKKRFSSLQMNHYSGKWNFYETRREIVPDIEPYFFHWKHYIKQIVGIPSRDSMSKM